MGTEFSIVLPCLNEELTVGTCIRKAHQGMKSAGVDQYEIIVADNGSIDRSREIAQAEGAIVVDVPQRGYGAALQAGISAACGKYVIMGDADDSYDFTTLTAFVNRLREGYQLVMGSRFKGEIKKGAMPFLHQYLGNPVLTGFGNLVFGCNLSDFHSGLRGFNREAILVLNLRTQGMEYASEMVIRATLGNLTRTEVPITLYPDGRQRAPHLRTWRDGWRHLRFMLIYSPRWLFLYPGVLLTISGLVITAVLAWGPLKINGIVLDVHTLLAGGVMWIVGIQLISFALFARLYAATIGVLPTFPRLEKFMKDFSLEVGLIAGLVASLVGLALFIVSVVIWARSDFGPLDYERILRLVIPGTELLVAGIQIFFSSFMISLLGIRTGR